MIGNRIRVDAALTCKHEAIGRLVQDGQAQMTFSLMFMFHRFQLSNKRNFDRK